MSDRENQSLDELQLQMQSIRGMIEEDVEELKFSTQRLVDWKTYVKGFPIASLTAAALAGYLIMPQKKQIVSPDADTIARLAKRNKLVVQMNPTPQKQSGLGGTIFGLASSMLFRGLTTYLGNQAGKFAGDEANQNANGSIDRQSYETTNS